MLGESAFGVNDSLRAASMVCALLWLCFCEEVLAAEVLRRSQNAHLPGHLVEVGREVDAVVEAAGVGRSRRPRRGCCAGREQSDVACVGITQQLSGTHTVNFRGFGRWTSPHVKVPNTLQVAHPAISTSDTSVVQVSLAENEQINQRGILL